MPVDYSNYPSDWHAISKQIRAERAGHICECVGECGTDHEAEHDAEIAEVLRELGKSLNADRCQAMNRCDHPITNSRVVLTVAHLCNCHPLCANPLHLKALCQRCHLRLDKPIHMRNAARTRRARKNNHELFPL